MLMSVPVKDSLSFGNTPGSRIRFFRRYKGLSQEALAKLVFTTQATIARWEADEFRPNRQAQVLLADVLEVDRLTLIPPPPDGEAA